MTKSLNVAYLLLLTFSMVMQNGFATSVAPPVQASELYGGWVGYSEGESEFIRLDLREGQIGYCAIVTSFNANGPHEPAERHVDVYRIKSWRLSGATVNFEVEKIGSNSESIFIRGIVKGLALQIKIGGVRSHWARIAILERASEVEAANELAASEIQKQASAK